MLWRTPVGVNALARHPWLVVVEAVTLVPLGMGLWLELVESPPLTPRLSRPHRVALAAVSMWTIWVLAYLVGPVPRLLVSRLRPPREARASASRPTSS